MKQKRLISTALVGMLLIVMVTAITATPVSAAPSATVQGTYSILWGSVSYYLRITAEAGPYWYDLSVYTSNFKNSTDYPAGGAFRVITYSNGDVYRDITQTVPNYYSIMAPLTSTGAKVYCAIWCEGYFYSVVEYTVTFQDGQVSITCTGAWTTYDAFVTFFGG